MPMSDITLLDSRDPQQQQPLPGDPAQCEECLGSGGWYRYEPALEPAPGLMYLSCLGCRGSGRLSPPRG